VRRRLLTLTLAVAVGIPAAVAQVVPDAVPEVPVLSEELAPGHGSTRVVGRRAPVVKVADGDLSDWVGRASGYGGTAVYSGGEYVYQDHLFDARGADDGGDAERAVVFGAAKDLEPRTYRLEALIGQDPPSQVGVDSPEPVRGAEHYGDVPHVDHADLLEVRVADQGDAVALLARTTTMTSGSQTAVLVLLDTADDGPTAPVDVPFGSGLRSERADVAVLLAGDGGRWADLSTGGSGALPSGSVATAPGGYVNAVEAVVPKSLLGVAGGPLRLAVAAGTHDGEGGLLPLTLGNGGSAGANVANVAFRADEAVRTWFERGQALALHLGTLDPFFVRLSDSRLRRGVEEAYVPGPGYHDRIFVSPTPGLSNESGFEGVHQHYGVYLPRGVRRGTPLPLTWWLHWRGGHAHSAASVVPRMFRTMGDGVEGSGRSIVVAPRGRGTSTWYVGRGHADVLEVWDDVFATFVVDPSRVYVSGHSMGGWGSYLLPLLYPDRFAAALPYAGPVTQGAWTGADFPGCDNFRWEEYTPCYIEANGSRPRDQHTRKMLENLRHVPVGIFQGAADELVPVGGVTRQVERLVELGYRHRYHLFPTYEHFSHPVADEWAAGARYAHGFRRPDVPARVTYVRDMPFERATEQVQAGSATFAFSFDRAYWMRGLTPADPVQGVARFDGTTLAASSAPTVALPEAGGPEPGQYGPFVMTGLRWADDPLSPPPVPSNGFEATLSGAVAVTLDLAGMALDPGAAVTGTVTTSGSLDLSLDGGWDSAPAVTCSCGLAPVAFTDGVLTVSLPAGTSIVSIG
jgi:dienelactone hydrolase